MLALLKRHLLQMKRNSKNQAKKLWIGEIVIIKDDKSELWRKGKINRFLESRDGEVRVADLIVFHPKTKNCMINRAIQHLISLEVSDNFEEENDFESKTGDRQKKMAGVRAISSVLVIRFYVSKWTGSDNLSHFDLFSVEFSSEISTVIFNYITSYFTKSNNVDSSFKQI